MNKHWQALEQIDADSWEELCSAVPADVAQTLQLSLRRQGSVVASKCLVADAPLGNRAIALGLGEPADLETLKMWVDDFKASGLQNFALQISPYAQPPELAEWTETLGLIVRSHWVKLERGREPAPSMNGAIDVQLVGSEQRTLFGEVSAQGFGRPPIIAHWMGATVGWPRWRHYLAYIDEQPAGAAAIYIDGNYAWLGIGSTLPDYRQRGVQQALIARRLADGLAMGVEHFVSETESRNVSCGTLMRAGFTIAYERPNYGIPLAC